MQGIDQDLHFEHIDSHTDHCRGRTMRQWTGRCRLLDEALYSEVRSDFDHAEVAGLAQRKQDSRQRQIRFRLEMPANQLLIVHLIHMIACENQHMLSILHAKQILIDRMGCTAVALAECCGETAVLSVPVATDMNGELIAPVLRQERAVPEAGVPAVGKRKVDDSAGTKGETRLRTRDRQREETVALSAGQDQYRKLFLRVDCVFQNGLHKVSALTVPGSGSSLRFPSLNCNKFFNSVAESIDLPKTEVLGKLLVSFKKATG